MNRKNMEKHTIQCFSSATYHASVFNMACVAIREYSCMTFLILSLLIDFRKVDENLTEHPCDNLTSIPLYGCPKYNYNKNQFISQSPINFICDVLRDLVPFVQFKKREKHQWRSATFSKVNF